MALKMLQFEMDFNRENRRAVAILIGKKRGLATEKECRDWVNETTSEALMDALMQPKPGRRKPFVYDEAYF